MSAPYTTGMACQSTVITANTVGTQLNLTAANQIATPVVPTCSGFLHTVLIGGDSTAETISIFDGTSTSGTLRFKGITPTTGQPGGWLCDIQFYVGMFISVAGGTTVSVTVTWE